MADREAGHAKRALSLTAAALLATAAMALVPRGGSDRKGTPYDPPYTEIGKDRVTDTPALSVTMTAIVHAPPTSSSKPGTT